MTHTDKQSIIGRAIVRSRFKIFVSNVTSHLSRESEAVEDYARMAQTRMRHTRLVSWILATYTCPETREYYPSHWRGRRALVHVITYS